MLSGRTDDSDDKGADSLVARVVGEGVSDRRGSQVEGGARRGRRDARDGHTGVVGGRGLCPDIGGAGRTGGRHDDRIGRAVADDRDGGVHDIGC